jgi:hypothetical protein
MQKTRTNSAVVRKAIKASRLRGDRRLLSGAKKNKRQTKAATNSTMPNHEPAGSK